MAITRRLVRHGAHPRPRRDLHRLDARRHVWRVGDGVPARLPRGARRPRPVPARLPATCRDTNAHPPPLCTTRVGIQALSPSSGQALFWISPSVAVAVLVGLGLDYDMSGTRPRHVRDMSRTGRARPRLRHLLDGLGHGALAERQGRQVRGGHFPRPGESKQGGGGERWGEVALGPSALGPSGPPSAHLATLPPCQAGTIISAAGVIMFLAFGCEQGSVSEVSRKCL